MTRRAIGNEAKRIVLELDDSGDLVPGGALSNPAGKNLGTSALLDPGRSEILASVTGDDDAALVLSITLARTENVQFAAGPVVGWPYAVIEWGNAGTSAQMEVDFLNGLVFPLPCSFLRIEGFNPANAFGPVKLGAFVTYLPTTRSMLRLKRSFLVGAILPGAASAIVPVPAFAGDVLFQRTNGQSFRVDFLDRNLNLLYSTNVGFDVQMNSTELAASVAGIRVTNTSFAQWDAGQLIFGLEI